jgi:hypothetical protein
MNILILNKIQGGNYFMELAKDEIFNIRYNAKLDRIEIKEENRITKFLKKHILLNMFLIAFAILSSVNFLLIYNFFNILKNI